MDDACERARTRVHGEAVPDPDDDSHHGYITQNGPGGPEADNLASSLYIVHYEWNKLAQCR